MKLIITLLTIVLSSLVLSQTNKTKTIDTSQICLPYSVAQQILLDLNNYDKVKELMSTYQKEIFELEKKVEYIKKENDAWKKEDDLNKEIISEKNNKLKIYESDNENLKKENKRLKTKNGIYNIISAVIIAPLTYIAIFK